MVTVALFPIPGCVTFPGVACPLHVFEPRYRQMVRHCLDENLWMGICHTDRVVHANPRRQTREEALNSNQSTYKPHDVFSAGPVTLMNELPDGRMIIAVEPEARLVLKQEMQTLPFAIWRCEALTDDAPGPGELAAVARTREKIVNRLAAITAGQRDIQAFLRSDYLRSLSAQDFSFAIVGRIAMDAELAQHLLETTDTGYRLDTLLALLNRGI